MSILEQSDLVNNDDLTYPKHQFKNQNPRPRLERNYRQNIRYYSKVQKLITKQNVASVYDQLGIIYPSHVLRKVIYRELEHGSF